MNTLTRTVPAIDNYSPMHSLRFGFPRILWRRLWLRLVPARISGRACSLRSRLWWSGNAYNSRYVTSSRYNIRRKTTGTK